MSPSSRAAIRFVIALFLAQTFVNAVAVPHPHIHKVLDPRQVVSLPVVERQEPAEPEYKNVFDAIIDTLKGYNGWQVVQDFFGKLFSGPAPEDDDNDNVPSIIVVPTPGASETPVDVISIIASVISEAVTATEPVVVLPSPTDAEESDGIMSILPIFPITTAIELFPTEEPSIPTELISELRPETTAAPEATDAPIVVVIPALNSTEAAGPTAPIVVVIPAVNSTEVAGPTAPIVVVIPTVEANSTDVGIALPTEILPPVGTAPIVTGPVVIAPIATETPLFPIENGTSVAPLPGTDVPVVVIVPTGISSPIEANASVSADANVTVSLTSTVGVTVTLEPSLIGTGIASVGTGLPITLSEAGPFANATTELTPTLILVTGTGVSVGTVVPTVAVDPIGAPFANSSAAATAVAPVGTGVIIIGTGILPSNGTAATSIEPIETIVLGTGIIGTGVVGTAISGTGSPDATAVAPIGTDLPLFPNSTAVEIVVEPTFVLGTGTAPAGTISAAPVPSEISAPLYANTTTTTVVNIITPSAILATGVETAAAPAGTIIIIPGPDNEAVLPNVTITVNASADATISVAVPIITDATILPAPVNITDASILPAPVNATELPIEATEVPSILPISVTDLAPVVPVETEFPTLPIESVTAVGPIIDEPIPTDEPVVEFPGEPIIPTLPVEEPTPALIVPIVPIESLVPVEEPTTTIAIPVPALTLEVSPSPVAPVIPLVPVAAVSASAAASVVVSPIPVVPIAPVVPVVPAAPVVPAISSVPAPPRIPTFPIPVNPLAAPVASVVAAVAPVVSPVLAPLRPGARFPPQ